MHNNQIKLNKHARNSFRIIYMQVYRLTYKRRWYQRTGRVNPHKLPDKLYNRIRDEALPIALSFYMSLRTEYNQVATERIANQLKAFQDKWEDIRKGCVFTYEKMENGVTVTKYGNEIYFRSRYEYVKKEIEMLQGYVNIYHQPLK